MPHSQVYFRSIYTDTVTLIICFSHMCQPTIYVTLSGPIHLFTLFSNFRLFQRFSESVKNLLRLYELLLVQPVLSTQVPLSRYLLLEVASGLGNLTSSIKPGSPELILTCPQ